MEITYARDTAEIDAEIAKLYKLGLTREEIGKRVGIASGSVSRRLRKMLLTGEITQASVFVEVNSRNHDYDETPKRI